MFYETSPFAYSCGQELIDFDLSDSVNSSSWINSSFTMRACLCSLTLALEMREHRADPLCNKEMKRPLQSGPSAAALKSRQKDLLKLIKKTYVGIDVFTKVEL